VNGDRPTRVRWIVFCLGCGTSWVLYLHRYTFALIKPKLAEEFDLGETELGAMDTAFSLSYASVQFPTGLLGDLAGVDGLLFALILVWSMALAMHAWAPTTKWLYAARALFGAAQAGCFALVGRLTRSWFPSRSRTTAQGWIGVSSGRIGGLCANLLFAGVMIGVFKMDWRLALYLLAGIGVAHSIGVLSLLRNSPREHPWSNEAEAELVEGDTVTSAGEPRRLKFRELLSRMDRRSLLNLAAINAVSTFSSIADQVYSNWIPLFLSSVYALEFKEMGIYSALPLLGGACGGVIGGFISDWLIRRLGNRRWARSLVGSVGKGLAAITLAASVIFFYDNPYKFCGMLFVVKLFADISLTSRWGTVTDIGGPVTASVFAFNNSVASLIAGMFPVVYGFVAEHHGWRPVFWIACAAYVACSATWLLVNCTIPVLREDPAPSEPGPDQPD